METRIMRLGQVTATVILRIVRFVQDAAQDTDLLKACPLRLCQIPVGLQQAALPAVGAGLP